LTMPSARFPRVWQVWALSTFQAVHTIPGRTAKSSGRSKNFAQTLAGATRHLPGDIELDLWWHDEMRLGQKNGRVRQWARKGTRPRQPADQRYTSAWLFGAICPGSGVGRRARPPG